jgi:hypothetical protein
LLNFLGNHDLDQLHPHPIEENLVCGQVLMDDLDISRRPVVNLAIVSHLGTISAYYCVMSR